MIGLALSAVIAACDSFAISFPSALLAAEKEEEEVANQRHLDYSRVLFSSSPPSPLPDANFDHGELFVAVAREE